MRVILVQVFVLLIPSLDYCNIPLISIGLFNFILIILM